MKKPFRAHIESPKVIHHINSKPLITIADQILFSYHTMVSVTNLFSIPIRKFDVFTDPLLGRSVCS